MTTLTTWWVNNSGKRSSKPWVTTGSNSAISWNDGSGKAIRSFSAIERDGERFSANQYMFALEQLHASHLFDGRDSNYGYSTRTGRFLDPVTNISKVVLLKVFIHFTQNLKPTKSAPLLHLKFENCFVNTPHHTALFCTAIRNAGADFGVDSYGRNFNLWITSTNSDPLMLKLTIFIRTTWQRKTAIYLNFNFAPGIPSIKRCIISRN